MCFGCSRVWTGAVPASLWVDDGYIMYWTLDGVLEMWVIASIGYVPYLRRMRICIS